MVFKHNLKIVKMLHSNYLVFFTYFIGIFADLSCKNANSDTCESSSTQNKYSAEANVYQTYLNSIKEAKLNYIPCNSTDCSCFVSNIKRDLKPFSKGVNKELLDAVTSKGTKYQIIENRLYRDKNCMFPARCVGIEHFLLKIVDKLPDMEFVVNTRDWPQIHRQYNSFGPVFSFSKTAEYLDIMYPAWAFWEGGPAISLYPRGIGRWDNHRKTLGKLGNDTKWNEKVPKAFFRGSRTSSERDALILLSRDQPDLVDAKYTKNQAWKSEEDTLNAPPAPEVSFEDHCRYKYLFNFRGVAASFRFKHILLCKSVVFHVGDEWQEFFYSGLKPWIHYIPVRANADKKEIETLLNFAKSHDDLVKEIAENGYNFIWNHLRLKDVSCYWLKLLKRYAKLLDYIPEYEDGFTEIKK